MFEIDVAIYAVTFSPVSVHSKPKRLRGLRNLYEERLADGEASLIETRTTLPLLNRIISDLDET